MKSASTSRKTIVIAGYYGHQNAGDEAILHGILTELRELDRELEFIVVSGNPEVTERLHHVASIAWSDRDGLINAVSGASLVVVGGGGLIQDYWGVDETSFLTCRQGGISEFGSPILLSKLLDVPCMFYGVGVGPLRSPKGQEFARLLFELADGATVRDEGSRALLLQIGTRLDDLPIVPDPAFNAPFMERDTTILDRLLGLPHPRIGVSLRYWGIDVDPTAWWLPISKALDQVIEQLGGSVVFVPMQVSEYFLENDESICKQILDGMRCSDRAVLIDADWNPLQRFFCMGFFDLVLGMRLHSLIAALRAGKPCVGIPYDPKVRALLEYFGLAEFCLEMGELDAGEMAGKLVDAYHQQERFKAISHRLSERSERPSKGAVIAERLMDRSHSQASLPRWAVDFALQQTRNLARSEDVQVTLNQVFRTIWGSRFDADFLRLHDKTDLSWIEQQLLADQERMTLLEQEAQTARERMQSAEIVAQEMRHELTRTEEHLSEENQKRQEVEESLHRISEKYWAVNDEFNKVKSSKGYRLLRVAWDMTWRIRDPKQQISELGVWIGRVGSRFTERTKGLRSWIGKVVQPILPAQLRYLSFLLRVHHLSLEDNSQVVLYAERESLFPGYKPRCALSAQPTQKIEVSLVTTAKNEADNARRWLQDLERQTRLPDEVILLEGGSTDSTLGILQAFAVETTLNLKVLSEPGKNIATRRNLGVRLATHPVIAMTDFGCTLKPDWLEKLLIPFEVDRKTEVVAGWYDARSRTRMGESGKRELVPSIYEISPQTFLPACRSIAFQKAAWETVGGFPEWLTKTGEDTYFDLQLKRKCRNWAFVPDAQVIWHAPDTLRGIWQKLSSWTVGDGESGAFLTRYWKLTIRYFRSFFFTLLGLALSIGLFWISPLLGWIALLLCVLAMIVSLAIGQGLRKGIGQGLWRFLGRAARVDGFLHGVRSRPRAITRRYSDIRGIVLFLSGVPIDDTGGGARGTQIALEFLHRGNLVVFVHKYPRQESVDLKLDFDQPRLLHFGLDDFDWKALRWELRQLFEAKPLTAILEFPFREYLPIAKDIQRNGGKVVYDLIDEWNTSLGGDWYSPSVEQAILKLSDVLVASAPSLVKRLEQASGREVLWLPNAVNLHLFDRSKVYESPEDLPDGSPRIVYIGALWGEWFDWELLGKIADEFPQAAIMVIGDYRGQCPFERSNLHFLGLKPQASLPAYLAHADVAIVPWEISPITQATSPLKVFEYVAMGVPVVAPALKPLEGIPYVFLAQDHREFLEHIRQAPSCGIEDQVLGHFLRENSWQARIDKLEEKFAHHSITPSRAAGQVT